MSQRSFTPVMISPSTTPHDGDIPVVFDSPHSGTFYPEDFGFVVRHATLRIG